CAEDLVAQRFRPKLPRIDVNVSRRLGTSGSVFPVASGDDYRFAEVVLVLDPVEVNAEARELFPVEMPFLKQRAQGLRNFGSGQGGERFLGVIDLQDHGVDPGCQGLLAPKAASGTRKPRCRPIFARPSGLVDGAIGGVPVGFTQRSAIDLSGRGLCDLRAK